jgi:hypothetical protein
VLEAEMSKGESNGSCRLWSISWARPDAIILTWPEGCDDLMGGKRQRDEAAMEMVVIALEDTLKKFAVMRYCPSDPDLEPRS